MPSTSRTASGKFDNVKAKDLGWLVIVPLAIVPGAVVEIGCDRNCDPEVEVNSAGVTTVILTCTVEITCDGVTEVKTAKFPRSGSPVRDQAECDARAREPYRADCTYEVDLENKCIPREAKSDDGREPTWIVGVAASTGYGDTDPGSLGAGGAGGSAGFGPGDT
jgi:hypothetical protein